MNRSADGRRGPLSHAQARLWFLERLQPGTPRYNVGRLVRLDGGLDVAALERALGGIVRRHGALRTTFAEPGGGPIQVVSPPQPFSLPVRDLRRLPGGRREREVARLSRATVQRPFDLGRGPLFRLLLLRLDDRQHVLLLAVHHIVFDGWSMAVLFRELPALYRSFVAGRPSPLPGLPLQYLDFAREQRLWLEGEAGEELLSYWSRRLDGAPAPLRLPPDVHRPPPSTLRSEWRSVPLGAALAGELRSLAGRRGVSLFMVLLAAFNVLLHRYTGREDIVIGTVVSGRDRAELEGLIGFFVNTLPLRSDLQGAPSFERLLDRVREATLDALIHQGLPFDLLVRRLGPNREAGGGAPLFTIVFVLQNTPSPALEIPGLSVGMEEVHCGLARFDLAVFVDEVGQDLSVTVEYARDLFSRERIEGMLGHYRRLLQAVAAGGLEVPVSRLPLLPAAERRSLVALAAPAGRPYPRKTCVHRLFRDRAEEAPEAVALRWAGRPWTYGALNRAANRLAHRLRRLGVGPEVVVGVCLPRSPRLIVALLAVLKAGGVYLPLDPDYPRERLGLMLDDAAARLILTAETVPRPPSVPGTTPVCLDREAATVAACPGDEPGGGAGPANLAYIIYTSGSTGRPKGVAVEHRGLCSLAALHAAVHGVDGDSRVLQFASPSFDGAIWECCLSLCSGATLVLAPADELRDPAALAALLDRERVTTAVLPPSMLALLPLEAGRHLRTLVVAGEACPPSLAAVWTRRVRLENIYGPTEATVSATSWRVPSGYEGREPMAIGSPLPNVQVHVLDRHLEPVPSGVTGELYIGGPGVARGYLGRPDLTAEGFIPDPSGVAPGARLYRTGDLGRRLTGGTIEFRGRADHQVKLRGFRIELGEVEAVLGRHPEVRQAVVAVREDRPGDRRLTAYVVFRGSAPPGGELRRFAARHLPEQMLPAAVVALEALPLLPSGKVDRGALPPPDESGPTGQRPAAAPRTATEEVLAAVWARVLGVEEVGVGDSFFDLGGHSLLAAEVISEARRILGVDIPLRALFERPTVAGLARSIGRRRRAGGRIRRRPPGAGPCPLSFPQERLWFLEQLQAGTNYTIPVSVRLAGPLDAASLERALGRVVDRHDPLRTTFVGERGRPLQVVHRDPGFSLPLVDLGEVPPAGRAALMDRLAAEEAGRRFDLERGPLLRAVLYRLAPEDHLLLLNVHHIVADGWSLNVMFREIAALYRSSAAARPPSLPGLPLRYADFCHWQREWVVGAEGRRQLSYWRRRLEGCRPWLDLPTDRPRPGIQTFRGARHCLEVPPPVARSLKRLGADLGATPFMTLLAAFGLLLREWTRQEDICVGTYHANRDRPDLQPLVGFLVNNLVLRLDLSGDPPFRDLIAGVRRTTLEAYEHQDLPFECLLSGLRLPRSPGRTPLFPVLFLLYHSQPGLPLPGATTAYPPLLDADFDLTLALSDEGGRVTGHFLYNAHLFRRETIAALASRYVALLRAVADRPERRSDDLPAGGVSAGTAALPPSPPAAPVTARGRGARGAPHTGVQRRLASIWTEVLGVERVDVADNFFSLGGTSLALLEVQDRAARGGLRLTLRDLLLHQTIAGLEAVHRRALSGEPVREE